MKKFRYILLCLAACAGLSGCGDLMETAPSNEVDKSLILKDVNAVFVFFVHFFKIHTAVGSISAAAHHAQDD